MRYSDYKCFRFGFDSGVAFVSIDHPPINLLDEALSQEFDKLGRELEADESVRVVVLQSALPDFFIALHSGLGACPRTRTQCLRSRPHPGPDTRLYLGAVGIRLKIRPARSTPTIAPLSSRVKKPRCPCRPPSVRMYSSPSLGSRPMAAGG